MSPDHKVVGRLPLVLAVLLTLTIHQELEDEAFANNPFVAKDEWDDVQVDCGSHSHSSLPFGLPLDPKSPLHCWVGQEPQ
jgi:hypothetical protein